VEVQIPFTKANPKEHAVQADAEVQVVQLVGHLLQRLGLRLA
jgi:hypothetical protein